MERNPKLAQASGTESAQLAAFASRLRFEDIPDAVVARLVDLFVDWAGSTFSGKGQRAVDILEAYAASQGPADGPAVIFTNERGTSPHFAALVNAAASHISEQDDVHNGSVFHPAAVVFPAALAWAQAQGASGKVFIAACVAGYEVGIRVGEFLGRSHYEVHHTTGTAGTLAAAAACANLAGLNAATTNHAFGSAGTQSAGLWEFLADAADSKQLHTAAAAADGLMSAWLAQQGFTGARRILEGKRGLAAGTSRDADPARLVDGLGSRWTVLETSFKFHASCRHTHPSADALLAAIGEHGMAHGDIARITAGVSSGALNVLGPVTDPQTVHQAKFSMPVTLGLIAVHGRAGMAEFDGALTDDAVRRFLPIVEMEVSDEVEAAYPARWLGRVTAETKDGRVFYGAVDEPKGDPGNTLSRGEIDAKARRLAAIRGAIAEPDAGDVIARFWSIADAESIAPGVFWR